MRAPATLQQARAQLAQAEANRSLAEREYRRQHAVNPQATTQTSIDQANAQLQSQTAAVDSATCAGADRVTGEPDDPGSRGHRRRTPGARSRRPKANLEQARGQSLLHRLRSPQDGWITERNVDKGTFVQAGQQVFYIVTPQAWIDGELQGDPACRHKARPESCRSASMPIPTCICTATWTASRPAAARASRPSRPRTPPATSSRSSAACR